MSEVRLTAQSDRLLCGRIAQALDEAGAQIVSSDDYQQLLSTIDQIYIDYSWEGKLFTLHLEHYLGIFLLSETLDVNALDKIARIVNSKLQ